jgi:hypothetical protein
MATATWNANKDNVSGTNYGSGVDIHLPVGYMSWLDGGDAARSFIGFSYSWTGWTAINSATLYIKTADGYHGSYAGDTVAFYVDLITASWSEGSSASGETWHSSDDISPTCSSTNRVTWSISNIAENTWYSKSVTAMVQQAWANGVFYGFRFMSSDEADANERLDIWSTEKGSSYDAYIVVDYSTNTVPNAPTNPSPTGSAIVNTLTPTFTATFSDPNAGDTQSNYQILLYEDNGTTLKWDSGTIAGTTINKVYNGPALTGNTYYQWKVRSADAAGAWGAYTALQRFKANSIPNVPSISLTQSPTTDVTTLTPTFNVTHSDPDATDSQLTGYQIVLETSGGTAVWDSGEVTVTARTTMTLVYGGSPALSWQTGYRWKAKTKDSNGAWSSYSGYATFTTHTTGIPISLDPTASEVVATDGSGNPMPTFVGTRASASDSLTSARIIVYQSDGVTQVWDSGTFGTPSVTATGFSKAYGGTTLAYSTTYKWKAQVTSSVGGTSAYSALQTFVTPAAGSISQTAPVSPVVDTTPDFTFGRTTAFNAWEIEVLDLSNNVMWDSGTQTMTSGTSKTVTYGTGGTVNQATLSWSTAYKWRVRVSADSGSTWGAGFTGYVQFTMDAAGIPTMDAPVSDSMLGAPDVIDTFDSITSVTNGTSASASQETTDKQVGRASMKIAITTLAAAGSSNTYRTVAEDLSKYGAQTPIKIWVKASSLTDLSTLRLRFTFATASDYVEYSIIPGTTNWEQKTLTRGTVTATSGTVNWSNVTRIGVVAVAGASSYTGDIFVDDLKFDASAPSFDGTTYNSEVISTYRVRVYASDQTTLVWDSGDTAGSGTTFSKLYTGTTLSKGSVYYWQARYVKSTGPTGAYSALTPFRLNSDPSIPTSLDPSTGETIADSTAPVFTATYEDVEKATLGDLPSAMEVEVRTNTEANTLAYSLFKDSGLVAAANSIYDGEAGVLKTTGAASPLTYETEYKWRVRYYDAMGAIGSWSSYVVFKPSQSPTTTITSPSDAGSLTSPAFSTSWSMSSPGGKGQNSYQFRIVRSADSFTVYDTGRSYSSATSLDFPAGTLLNSTTYLVEVRTWDTDGLVSAWDSNSVTTNWTAPDPVVGFSAVADPVYSAMHLWWEESTLPVGETNGSFRRYTIYRKLPSETTWTVLDHVTTRSVIDYYDYMTANTVTYNYKITQWKIVTGDADLESGDSDLAEEMLDADSWFVVGADRRPEHIFELPVTAGPFAEPVQQEVFEPLGTNRKVIVRGKTLGAEGSMQCRWKDEERATAIMQVDYIKSNAGPHILKSPFGDIWEVEFSGPTKDYLGGGHMNATLVWTEVA